jgi:putative nucleotidyltransferase with HDIG domain
MTALRSARAKYAVLKNIVPIVGEDSLASSLQLRLNELLSERELPESRSELLEATPSSGPELRLKSSPAASSEPRVTMPRHLKRYLPLSIFATLVVIVGPVALVSLLMPDRGILWQPLAVALAVLGSLAFASVGAWLWKRWARSREMIFAELMLWGWVRRFWVERRLQHTHDLFESARRHGPTVSIELLTQLSDLHQSLDPYVHGHSRRVASYAVRIAREMHLSATEVAKIETSALVHDIGKIYTPAEILHKPDRLTDREFAIIKLHAPDGADIVAQAGDPEITASVRHHHERLDGNGYPDGIAGAEISLGARIIAVADTFDAITSVRPYRPPRTHREAIEILSKESGKQLDTDAVAAFIACYAARRLVRRSAFASAVPERLLTALKASSANLAGGSIAQTIPALGAAGVLALAPALHQKGEIQQVHRATVARLASNGPPVSVDETQSSLPPIGGRLRSRKNPSTIPPSHAIRIDPSKSPTTRTHERGPFPQPSGSEQEPTPASPGSEASKPTSSTPDPPSGAPSHPTVIPSPKPTSPPATVQAPVAVTIPAVVNVPVPSVPVPAVSVPSLSTPTVSVPSVSTPSVSLPAVEVPPLTTPSVNLHVGG